MIDYENFKEDNKILDLDTLLIRAKSAEDNQKYTIAANHYFTILTRHLNKLSQQIELLELVSLSFCYLVVLLPVNFQRERMLNFLLKNENLNVFEQKPILDKLYRYQLINEEELNKFLRYAPDKFKAENIFEKAIFEHNLISLSRIYENISFATIQRFLNIQIEKILNYTFKMIIENRIKAKIDEINQFIYFEPEQINSLFFDTQINNFCMKVVELSEYIKSK